MTDPLPFPIFILLSALLSCLLVHSILVIVERAVWLAHRALLACRKLKFTIFTFEYEGVAERGADGLEHGGLAFSDLPPATRNQREQ